MLKFFSRAEPKNFLAVATESPEAIMAV